MDSREFLDGDDAKIVINNDEKIKKLSKEYIQIYRSLDPSTIKSHNFMNIEGSCYASTHNSKGFMMVDSRSDEFELHEAFSKASDFGMQAIDSIHNSIKVVIKKNI